MKTKQKQKKRKENDKSHNTKQKVLFSNKIIFEF